MPLPAEASSSISMYQFLQKIQAFLVHACICQKLVVPLRKILSGKRKDRNYC